MEKLSYSDSQSTLIPPVSFPEVIPAPILPVQVRPKAYLESMQAEAAEALYSFFFWVLSFLRFLGPTVLSSISMWLWNN